MPVPKSSQAQKHESVADRIYEQLLRWIVNGTLQPGEKLNEVEIASFFSVSRTPVHEALLLLERERFTDIYPARGSFVSRLSRKECDAVYEAISGVASSVARLACEKREESDLDRLVELNAIFAKAQVSGDVEQVLAADRSFHTAVAQMADNPFLLAYHQQLQAHVFRFEYILSAIGFGRESSIAAHDALIEALRVRDADAAEAATNRNWLDCYREQRAALWEAITRRGWDADQ